MDKQKQQELVGAQAIKDANVHSNQSQQDKQSNLQQNKEKLLEYVRTNIIGNQYEYKIKTVYGDKPLVYADYTASGKTVKFIEDYIQQQILPAYSNTHSVQSGVGKQSTNEREEARSIIKRCCNANEDDACIFEGTGATGAINLLVSKLRLKDICDSIDNCISEQEYNQVDSVNFCKQNRWGSFDCTLCNTILASLGQYEKHSQSEFHKRNIAVYQQKSIVYTQKPVVFLSVYEHNSNLIPWRETGSIVEIIPSNKDGLLDFEFLEQKLQQYKNHNSLKVGSFSAGSNITGQIFDVDRIAVLCHQYNTLACFDYAAVGPYVDINMNGPSYIGDFPRIEQKNYGLAYKDAIFISVHKFIGGPGSSGVLLAKKKILFSRKPHKYGGGIVFFVNEKDHEFVQSVEELEEAGTPGVIQDIKAGLAFQLKEAISTETIKKRDDEINKIVLERLYKIKNLLLLGNNNHTKIPIYIFLIKSKNGKFLNPNFVVSLLNDLFGIQCRGGCQCAALLGQKLLGVDLQLTMTFKEALFEGNELLRVGYTRLNFSYILTDDDVHYIIDAIEFIANYGWMFLPHYQFDQDNGVWRNRNEKEIKVRTWLGEIDYSSGKMTYGKSEDTNIPFFKDNQPIQPLSNYIDFAKDTLVKLVENYKNIYGKSMIDQKHLIPEQYQPLLWFLFPSEVLPELLQMKYQSKLTFEYLQSYNSQHPQNDIILLTPFTPLNFNNDQHQYLLNNKQSLINDIENNKESHEEDEESSFLGRYEVEDENNNDQDENIKKQKKNLIKIPKDILSYVGAAIRDFDMIKEGDKILIGLSGGKDSLALIHILRHFQSVAPIKFEIGAVTIDPQVYEYNPKPLIPYLKSLNIPYFMESDAIVERAQTCMQKNSICSFCSRMKRGMIYNCARREGYNVIAMGQHLDDLAESFVMSVFHNGYLRTMKANYTIDKGDLRVIRPLVYCREALFKEFSTKEKLPIITDNCPACFSAPKERHRIKLMLAQQEHLFPSLFSVILKAIIPLMKGNFKDIIGNNVGDEEDDDEEGNIKGQAINNENYQPCCSFDP